MTSKCRRCGSSARPCKTIPPHRKRCVLPLHQLSSLARVEALRLPATIQPNALFLLCFFRSWREFVQYLALDPFPAVTSYLSSSTPSSRQLRSKSIYVLSGLLKHNAAAIAPFGLAGGWEALRGALSGIAKIPLDLSESIRSFLTPVGRAPSFDTYLKRFVLLHEPPRLGHRRSAQNRVSPHQPPQ